MMLAAGAAQLYAGGLPASAGVVRLPAPVSCSPEVCAGPGGQRRLLFPARPDLRDLHLRYWHGFCLR